MPYLPSPEVSSDASSLLEGVDLGLVEDIIKRAWNAKDFIEVLAAYKDVLEENGISEQRDTVYYNLLLKVGSIRAETYSEKWYIWLSTHEEALEDRNETSERSKLDYLRASVPFLASASSDLDEGFADESGDMVYDGDSVVDNARESPRTVMGDATMRSLVGHTPSPSDMSDLLEALPLPARTSTPVYAQGHGLGLFGRRDYDQHQTPSLSVDESEMGQSSLHSDDDLDDLVVNAEFMTPRPRQLLVSLDPGRDTEFIREMEQQADDIYHSNVMSRCWRLWSFAFDSLKGAEDEADADWKNALLRDTMNKWRVVLHHHLAMPNTADAHYAHHVQYRAMCVWIARLRKRRLLLRERAFMVKASQTALRKSWTKWRSTVDRQSRMRWEAEMKTKEIKAVHAVTENRLREVFRIWQDRTRNSRAKNFDVRNTTRSIFTEWYASAMQLRLLRGKLVVWDQRRTKSVLTAAFDAWYKQATLQPLERDTLKNSESRIISRVWSQWRLATWQSRNANALNDRRILFAAMRRIKRSIREAKAREKLADDIVSKRDLLTMKRSFYVWARQNRGRLLQQVIERRRMRQSFAAWGHKMALVGHLDGRAVEFATASDTRKLHDTFSRWRDTLGYRLNETLKADLIFAAKTKSEMFAKWRSANAKIAENTVVADKANDLFIKRTSFKAWHYAQRWAVARRRQEVFIERRRLTELKEMFDEWRAATQESIVRREEVERFRSNSDKRLLAHSLRYWTERVVEIKAREFDVMQRRDNILVQEAFRRWAKADQRRIDRLALLQSFSDIKTDGMLRLIVQTWAQRAQISRNRRLALDAFEKEINERLVGEAFTKWFDRKREIDLRQQEDDVAQLHEDALLFEVFEKWTSRTIIVPAISFDKRRLKLSIWPKWRRAVERAKEIRSVTEEYDKRLLENTFTVWKKSCRARLASKPAERRRRKISGPGSEIRVSSTSLGTIYPTTSHSYTRQRPSNIHHPRPSSHNRLSGSDSLPASRPTRILPVTSAAVSVASEPAYSRLRSELQYSHRGRASSDEHPGGEPRGVGDSD